MLTTPFARKSYIATTRLHSRESVLALSMWESGWVDLADRLIARLRPLGSCLWFAKCDRPATHYAYHPVLGDIPICERCTSIITLGQVDD